MPKKTTATDSGKRPASTGGKGRRAGPKKTQDHKSFTTTDHDTIRKWIEDRGGVPARVKSVGGRSRGGRSGGLLRVDFQDKKGALEPIGWEEFFEAFDHDNLVFLYQETINGKPSRFFKFVSRETAEEQGHEDLDHDHDAAALVEEEEEKPRDPNAVLLPDQEADDDAGSESDDENLGLSTHQGDVAPEEADPDKQKEVEVVEEEEDDDDDEDDDDEDGEELIVLDEDVEDNDDDDDEEDEPDDQGAKAP